MPQAAPSAAVVAPNLYQLAGGGISISYIPSGAGGQPFFAYQDTHRTLHFFGKEIQQAEVADLGTVVSVTLVITVDLGSTTFSVLLPRVNLPDHRGASAFITTEGITTVHSLSIAPGINLGQRDTYTTTADRYWLTRDHSALNALEVLAGNGRSGASPPPPQGCKDALPTL